MVRFRNAVTLTCFVAFSIVASLAALRTLRAGLPETPSTTGAAMLLGHLSEIDLSGEPRLAKRHMARRAMRELRDDVDWQPDVSQLSSAQQKQLVDNLTELAQEVIEDKMDHYFTLPERERRRFLNRQIDEVTRWAVVLDRATRGPGENTVQMAALGTLMTRLNKWYLEAAPEKRQQLQEFQRAFAEQLTERFKRGMRPNGN